MESLFLGLYQVRMERTSGTPHGAPRSRRERNRQLIQQFQAEVAEDDPMNPDSKSFDAKSYFKDLLRSKALPDLMKVDIELAKGN